MTARRVLMVTARWPPHGTIGVRRAVRLARYLPACGWTPVVLADDPARAPYEGAPVLDASIAEPPVEVRRVGATFPLFRARSGIEGALSGLGLGRAAYAFRRLSRGLLLPDHYVEWTPAAVRAARALAPVDVVWTTGPPHGVFVAAAAAARALRVPLVLDYRDAWSTHEPGERRASHLLRMPPRAHGALEGALIRRAAGVSAVNDDILDRNRAAFGMPSGAVWRSIPNGFDASELEGLAPLRNSRPTLLYAGNCFGGRSLLPVLQALAEAWGPGESGLQLEVYGELDSASAQHLQTHPLPGRVRLCERVPSAEILRRLLGADALLLLIGPEFRAGLTGKIFDYVAARRPVLGVGPADAAAAALVRDGGVGEWVASDDRPGLVAALRAVEAGTLAYAPRPDVWRPYTAEAMAERTAALLDAVVSSGPMQG